MANELLTSLLSEYEQKKHRAEKDAEMRKKELYEKIPRLQEIENELNSAAINTAKSILSGGSQSIETLTHEVEKLKKEKENIFRENNISSDFLEPHYECNICKDTGYIQNGTSASTICSCLKQKLLDISYNKSNISNIKKENFDTFNPNIFSDKPEPEKYKINFSPRQNILSIKEKCIEFIDNFENPDYHNLLFTGNTGLGKTFMSNCIANELIKRGKNVFYKKKGKK